MPNAAIVAAALTDHSARSFALWVGGVDWLKQPGAAGNLYGVPIESIEVTEAGPGGVSSLRCTLEDPSAAIPLPSAGSEVHFYDIADDHPEFLGFVQSIDVRPMQPTGRYFDLTAIGIEILLDWEIVESAVTEVGAGSMASYWQAAAANTPLRAGLQSGPGQGTQATPIGGSTTASLAAAVTVTNQTLRETLRILYDQGALFLDLLVVPIYHVDFTRGLRIWGGLPGVLKQPDDYVTLTVDDTAHTNGSAQLRYTLTPADIVRGVRVVGGGGYTGTFSDGSGIVGQTAVLNDSTITTADQGAAAAIAYLRNLVGQVRGSLHLDTFSHGTTKYQAGSFLTLTDATVGLSAQTFNIFSITKRYNSNGSEEWDVAFGGLAPSLSRSIRRQTRDTLS